MGSISQRQNLGFSLVEVMVGMAMSLIVLLVIMQAFSAAEAYKRTTTSGADSQTNGLMAMRILESEIRVAGYGMTNGTNLCPSINKYFNGTITANAINMPVKIVDGGTAADSIEVVYSSSVEGAVPMQITTAMPTPSNATFVNNTTGVAVCDFLLLASKDGSKACTLEQATNVFASPAKFLTSSGQSKYDPPGGALPGFFPTGGYTTNDIVLNVGSFVDKRFSVSKTSGKDEYFLRQSNLNSDTGGCGTPDPNPNLDMISNIVTIKAQYGVAPVNSQQVTCWTGAATTDAGCAISAGDWSAPPAVDVKRIKAIRIAVVARSSLAEKPSTGTTCDTTTTAPTSWSALATGTPPTIDLSADTNWQCYRYKVYQTIVPMINVIWANT